MLPIILGLVGGYLIIDSQKEKLKFEDGGEMMAKGGKLDSGVYRVGKPTKVSPNLYEQKIVEIFDNGDIATASDYGRKLSDFSSQKYPIISKEKLDAQYKYADGGKMAKGGMSDRYSTEVGDEVLTFVKNRKEVSGFPVYARISGNAPITVGVFPTKEKAMAKAKQLEKNNKMADGGKMAKGGIYTSDDRWKVTFQNQDNAEFETITVRANNKKNAIAIAEDESGLSSDWQYYSAEKEMADGGKMANGGGVGVKLSDVLKVNIGFMLRNYYNHNERNTVDVEIDKIIERYFDNPYIDKDITKQDAKKYLKDSFKNGYIVLTNSAKEQKELGNKEEAEEMLEARNFYS